MNFDEYELEITMIFHQIICVVFQPLVILCR